MMFHQLSHIHTANLKIAWCHQIVEFQNSSDLIGHITISPESELKSLAGISVTITDVQKFTGVQSMASAKDNGPQTVQ